MNTLIYRYLALSTLVIALCVQMGLVVWTLVRFTQIEHWSPGIQFFGNEMTQTKGLMNSAVNNLQEGTWFHLVRIRRGRRHYGHASSRGQPSGQSRIATG